MPVVTPASRTPATTTSTLITDAQLAARVNHIIQPTSNAANRPNAARV